MAKSYCESLLLSIKLSQEFESDKVVRDQVACFCREARLNRRDWREVWGDVGAGCGDRSMPK